MLLRTVLLIGSFSTLLCFVASDEIKVKLVIGGEDKKICPNGFPDEKHSDLVIDNAFGILFEKKTGKILIKGNEVYASGKTHLTGLVHNIPVVPGNIKEEYEVAVILYVRRRLGLRGDNDIYYGYNPFKMYWDQSPAVSEPTADGSEWKVHPFRIASLFDGKTTHAFDCEDPAAWIANHGIYKITKDGAAENLYYDPKRDNHKYLI